MTSICSSVRPYLPQSSGPRSDQASAEPANVSTSAAANDAVAATRRMHFHTWHPLLDETCTHMDCSRPIRTGDPPPRDPFAESRLRLPPTETLTPIVRPALIAVKPRRGHPPLGRADYRGVVRVLFDVPVAVAVRAHVRICQPINKLRACSRSAPRAPRCRARPAPRRIDPPKRLPAEEPAA